MRNLVSRIAAYTVARGWWVPRGSDPAGLSFTSSRELVFVCKGNICRSAYAQKVANSYGLETVSCGIDVEYSTPSPDIAVDIAGQRGLNLRGHRSRSIYDIEINSNMILLVMEPSQLFQLARFQKKTGCQLGLLGLWAAIPTPIIMDPFGGSSERFEMCFDLIESAVSAVSLKLKENS